MGKPGSCPAAMEGTMTTRAKDGDEVTCVPGWTPPLLWEPPAVRRRRGKKRGPTFFGCFHRGARREGEKERHRPTFLLLVLPLFHIRERTRRVMSHCIEATTTVVGLWSVFLPRLQDSDDDCERKGNGS